MKGPGTRYPQGHTTGNLFPLGRTHFSKLLEGPKDHQVGKPASPTGARRGHLIVSLALLLSRGCVSKVA